MGLKKAFKKLNKTVVGKVFNPLGIGVGGPVNQFKGFLKSPSAPSPEDFGGDMAQFEAYAQAEEARRRELAQKQRGQIDEFAGQYEGQAKDFRTRLAENLARTGQETFERANPFILEDLNARGLFSSPSEIARQQAETLGEITTENNRKLSDFDLATFNELQDLKGTGLSTLLGGDQDALDAALELRRGGLQRRFDVQDQNRQNEMATYLAKRQSRDNLLGSLIGLGGRLFSRGQ